MDIKNMTLDIKIGQMIMAGFPSKMYDEHLKSLIEEKKIGNIILFSRNLGSTDEIIALTRSVQRNMMDNIGIPAFLSVDQEGGTVTRIHEGVTFFPGNMAFTASGLKEATISQGEIVGKELRNLGINLVLAPVLDVNNNPDNPVIGVRSYGDNPEVVSRLGTNFIKGLHTGGVAATAKHFPGHGDTSIDSHLDLPIVKHDMKRLMKIELPPFIKAINEGVDMIMSCHILFPEIEEKNLPATLSYKVITKLLKERLGFQGIVITDCMEMNAIASYYGTENAAVMAVKAGADIICISHSLKAQLNSHTRIKEAVLKGEISENRIDESVKKIIEAKNRYSLFTDPYPDEHKVKIFNNSKENNDYARMVSEKSIVALRDDRKLIPISGKVISISTDATTLTGAENEIKRMVTFSEALRNKFGGKAFTIPLDPDKEIIKGIVNACRDVDRVIIGVYNSLKNQGQIELVKAIENINKNIILVALRSPNDISSFKEISTIICTFEYDTLSVNSAIKILAGEVMSYGKLPINTL